MAGILNSHVTEGKLNFKDLKDGQLLKTINGKELLIKVTNGKVTVNLLHAKGRDGEKFQWGCSFT